MTASVSFRQGAAPAAGADWTYTVPDGEDLTVLTFWAQIVTSAVAGNRRLRVVAEDADGNEFWAATANAAITATSTVQFTGGVGNESVSHTSSLMTVGLPVGGLQLPAGSIVRASTDGIDVGDQWTAPTFQIIDSNARP